MYLPRTSCIICGLFINKIQYNLKTTLTEKSNVLLIKLVEKLYKNVLFLHCNICTACYDVLNELDAINQRQKELITKLKENISKIDKNNLDESSSSDNEGNTNSDSDAVYYSPSSKKKAITATRDSREQSKDAFVQEEIKVDNIDLKKLPITIKRVRTEINKEADEDDVEQSEQMQIEADEDENEKLFEEIQSSIKRELTECMAEQIIKEKPGRDFLCEICGVAFKTQMGYSNHIKKHDDIEDETRLLMLNKINEMWLCNVCKKSFPQKSGLNRHMLIHTGISRYQCEECGKNFIHYSSFRMHQKIHANQRDAICEFCQHAFLTKSHLKRHLRTAHQERIEYFHCDICSKSFVEKYYLAMHMKKHQRNKKINVLAIEDPLALPNRDTFMPDEPVVNQDPLMLNEAVANQDPLMLNEPVANQDPLMLNEPVANGDSLMLDEPLANQIVLGNTTEIASEISIAATDTNDLLVDNGDLTIYSVEQGLGNSDGLLRIHEPTTGLTYTIKCNNLF